MRKLNLRRGVEASALRFLDIFATSTGYIMRRTQLNFKNDGGFINEKGYKLYA